jgi:hypothetical protein
MDGAATVRDDGFRWAIEPMFSDFKSRGFGLEDTQLRYPERLARRVLVLTLAMYWCVETGSRDAREAPTPLEKNRGATRYPPWVLAQARPLLPVVVPAPTEEAPALGRDRAPTAELRSTASPQLRLIRLKLIGGKICCDFPGPSPQIPLESKK